MQILALRSVRIGEGEAAFEGRGKAAAAAAAAKRESGRVGPAFPQSDGMTLGSTLSEKGSCGISA